MMTYVHCIVISVNAVAAADCDVLLQRLETALHTAVEQSAGAEVVEALLFAGANYDVAEKVLLQYSCLCKTLVST